MNQMMGKSHTLLLGLIEMPNTYNLTTVAVLCDHVYRGYNLY